MNWPAATSNLEYDIARGERGRRDAHTSQLLSQLTGAEAAIVVNNNAAAVFLVLNTLAKGAEVIVSRGELIEIGDGFRIPDILSESGAILREVGTTNRTRVRDYERAIGDAPACFCASILPISASADSPSAPRSTNSSRWEIARSCPCTKIWARVAWRISQACGIAEPLVRQSCAAGAALVSFSGDKLLGGPQAGIVAGRKEMVERIRRNPLFRALRVDKLTIAALEATLRDYRRGALDEIPALRMIRMSAQEIARRCAQFIERLNPQLAPQASLEIVQGFSVVGGGSTPGEQLPTQLIAVRSPRYSAAALEQKLRTAPSGALVVARIENGRLVLDLRTVSPDEEPQLASTLAAALV